MGALSSYVMPARNVYVIPALSRDRAKAFSDVQPTIRSGGLAARWALLHSYYSIVRRGSSIERVLARSGDPAALHLMRSDDVGLNTAAYVWLEQHGVMRHFNLMLVALNLTLTSSAQILQVGNTTERIRELRTLASGPRYVTINDTAFTVRNLDLSVEIVVDAPPLQAPYKADGITYITEALFDLDPSTIEYCQSYRDTTSIGGPPWNASLGIRILRNDGAVLFDQFPAYHSSGGNGINGSAAIFNTTEDTFMVVDSVASGRSTVYLLPGHLPCVDCNGSPNMLPNENDQVQPSDQLLIFPNPTADAATVRYELPSGTVEGSIVFFSTNGELVKRMNVIGSGTRTITTADMAAGTYLYQLETDQGVIGAKRLVVVK